MRQRMHALRAMDGLSPNTFKKMFRVDHKTFDEVMERITPFVKVPNEVKAFNSSGGPITLKTRLAVSLCWLAGGSYLDLCFAWDIAFSTFYHPTGVLWPTLEAINKGFSYGFSCPRHFQAGRARNRIF